MPNLKDIRKRIGSVKNTQKITRAMKMVAAAKLKRAQNAVSKLRPYARTIERVALYLLDNVEREGKPLLREPETTKRLCLIVVSSDRGLCGAYNTNVNRAAHKAWKDAEAEGIAVEIFIVGSKGYEFFKRRKAPIRAYLKGAWGAPAREVAAALMDALTPRFVAGEIDEVRMVSTEFQSVIAQEVQVRTLLPLRGVVDVEIGEEHTAEAAAMLRVEMPDISEYIYEPSEVKVLETMLPMYLTTLVQSGLLESAASEQGSRMTAMDNATNNAGDMISSLTMKYNRARQAAITTELIEIISGASAL